MDHYYFHVFPPNQIHLVAKSHNRWVSKINQQHDDGDGEEEIIPEAAFRIIA